MEHVADYSYQSERNISRRRFKQNPCAPSHQAIDSIMRRSNLDLTRVYVLLILVGSGALSARTANSADALRESFFRLTPDAWLIAAEASTFSEDFDVIGYLDSLEDSSRPDKYRQSAASLAYKFDAWRPFIKYREVSGSLQRSSQPFEVESNADYWGVGLAYSTGDADGGGSAVFTLTSAMQDDVTIDCYERSGVILGGACEQADFQLIDGDVLLETGDTVAFPVLTSSAEALSAELSFNWWRRWSSYPILLGHTLKLAGSQVEHDSYSPLYDLQSSFLLLVRNAIGRLKYGWNKK